MIQKSVINKASKIRMLKFSNSFSQNLCNGRYNTIALKRRSVNFKLIREAVSSPDMKVKLQFLLSVIPLFEQFLQDF